MNLFACNMQLSLTDPLGTFAKMPTSGCGDEPDYEPDPWNKNPEIKESCNCYAYACNDRRVFPVDGKWPEPGSPYDEDSKIRCPTLFSKTISDTGGKASSCDEPCKCGSYKVMVYVGGSFGRDRDGNVIRKSINPNSDFHYYRQDGDGFWSHKPGQTDVTDRDGSGNLIIDPRSSNREFCRPAAWGQECTEYRKLCGCVCLPKGGVVLR